MKQIKNVILAALAVMIVFCLGVFQSCSNEMDAALGLEKQKNAAEVTSEIELNSSERAEIINSIVFEEYIKANIELTSVLLKIQSLPKDPSGNKNIESHVAANGAMYKKYPFKVDESLIAATSRSFTKLNETFPLLKKCKLETIKSLIKEASLKSKNINKLLLEKGFRYKKSKNVRQKIGIYEGNGIFAFDDPLEAMFVAMTYSRSVANDECSGFLLNNGTAILYINPNGSHSAGVYPAPSSIICCDGVYDAAMYNGDEIIATFHTHFNGSCSSGPDEYSQLYSYPNAAMIILYDEHIYYYEYENGYENGTQSHW